MTPATAPAAAFLLSLVASAALTAGWTTLARRRQWVDAPDPRRLHSTPTPRGGGVGIAVCGMAALAAVALTGSSLPGADWMAVGVAGFALVGLIDDLRPLSPLVKLLGQLLAALALVQPLASGGWMLAGAWALAAAYSVNIVNFMDGSNGLVAVQGLLLAAALAFWPGQAPMLALLACVVAGACVGFLPFNLPRARVFLGDVGSHALGALLFGLVAASLAASVLSPAQALLLGMPLLLDTGLTLLRRAREGRPLWQAHREHLYQLAIARGRSHLAVCLAYAAWTVTAIALALWLPQFRSSLVMWMLTMLAWCLAAGACVHLRRQWLQQRGARHD